MTMTENQLDGQLVMLAIQNGLCDSHLEAIIEMSQARRKMLAAAKAMQLKPGDRFYLINISPKYLAGELVEYIGPGDTDLWLKCEFVNSPPGRFRNKRISVRRGHVGAIVSREV